jgi:hypothetical protein
MTVGQLKEALEVFDNSVEVVIDHDANGWYDLQDVNPSFDGKNTFCHLKSSSEI